MAVVTRRGQLQISFRAEGDCSSSSGGGGFDVFHDTTPLIEREGEYKGERHREGGGHKETHWQLEDQKSKDENRCVKNRSTTAPGKAANNHYFECDLSRFVNGDFFFDAGVTRHRWRCRRGFNNEPRKERKNAALRFERLAERSGGKGGRDTVKSTRQHEQVERTTYIRLESRQPETPRERASKFSAISKHEADAFAISTRSPSQGLPDCPSALLSPMEAGQISLCRLFSASTTRSRISQHLKIFSKRSDKSTSHSSCPPLT